MEKSEKFNDEKQERILVHQKARRGQEVMAERILFQNKQFILSKQDLHSLFLDIVQIGHQHDDQVRQGTQGYNRPVGIYHSLCQGCHGTNYLGKRQCIFNAMSGFMTTWVSKLAGSGEIEQIEIFKTISEHRLVSINVVKTDRTCKMN